MNIKACIALTFAYYHPGQALSDAVLGLYAEDLADISEEDVVLAYQAYRRNPKNTRFPLPAAIRAIVNPEEFISPEQKAAEVAARISGAIVNYGYNNAREAAEFIGPMGWDVVQKQGGWSYLCENHGTTISPSAFQAQVRNQLEAAFRNGVIAMDQAVRAPLLKERPEIEKQRLLAREIIRRVEIEKGNK